MGWSFECAGDLKLMNLGALIHRKCIYITIITIPRRKVYGWGLNQPLLITFAVFWRLVQLTIGGNNIVLWPVVDHLSRKEPNLLRLAGDRCPVGWSSIRCVVVGSYGTIRGSDWILIWERSTCIWFWSMLDLSEWRREYLLNFMALSSNGPMKFTKLQHSTHCRLPKLGILESSNTSSCCRVWWSPLFTIIEQ